MITDCPLGGAGGKLKLTVAESLGASSRSILLICFSRD
jgi:hypothetical protein